MMTEVQTIDEAAALLNQSYSEDNINNARSLTKFSAAKYRNFTEADKQVIKDYVRAYDFLAKEYPELRDAYQAAAECYRKAIRADE